MSILVGKLIDQMDFDRSQRQRTLPVVLGQARARTLDRSVVVGMYAIVAVLEHHHSALEIDSELGRGTTFRARFAAASLSE